MTLTKKTLQTYLEARFRVTPGCWIWTGSLSPKGYGKLQIGNYHLRAHRVSYEVYVGPITDPELMVLHRCDNPSCVNPEHLRLGTNADNMKDKKDKGRSAKGEGHGMAKLSNAQRTEIWNELQAGAGIRPTARKWGVSTGCICNIKNRGLV